jgi:hypothetical protein
MGWLRRGLLAAALAAGLAGLALLVLDRLAGVESMASFGLLLAGGTAAALLLERALRSRATERSALVAAGLCGLLSIELAVSAGLYPALDSRNSPRTIGVYRNDTVAAGIGYYARHPVRELRKPSDVTDFIAQGGKVVVIEDRRLAEIGRATLLRKVGQSRSRHRLFHVMAPAD